MYPIPITEGEYHTIRMEMAPGGTLCDIYVDNMITPALSVLPMTDFAGVPLVFAGDTTSGAAGEASWDYFYVNAIPEPTSLVLLAGALMSLLVWRRR